MKFDFLLKMVNAEINRIKKYLTDNADALFKMHDLKLHGVSYYCYTDFEKDFPLLSENSNADNEFNAYCEITFTIFQEDIAQECNAKFETLAHYIGRTSKFYFNDFHNCGRVDECLNDLLNHFDACNYFFGVDDAGNYTDSHYFDEYPDDVLNDIYYIIFNLYDDVAEHYAPFIRAYEILKGFKDNQVSDFKEFCEQYETELQEQRDAEIAQEKADNETITAIIKKYDITPDDITTIKKTIYAL